MMELIYQRRKGRYHAPPRECYCCGKTKSSCWYLNYDEEANALCKTCAARLYYRFKKLKYKSKEERLEANRNKRYSEEHKQRLSQIHKKRCQNPDVRLKLQEMRAKQIFPLKDTDIEGIMQDALTKAGIPFQKHRMFRIGDLWHQVDIFIEPNICIECDGDYWHSLPEVKERDAVLTTGLQLMGYRVLRFKGKEIKNNIQECLRQIPLSIN